MIFGKIKPFLYLGGFYVLLSSLLRLILLFHPITTGHFDFIDIIRIFGIGFINDSLVFALASSFLALYFLFLSNSKFHRPWGWVILGLMVLAELYIAFYPNNIFRQYGGVVAELAMIFIGVKIICFALMLFLPKQRRLIRNINYFIIIFLYVLLIILNLVSEYFFWNEFGVRYNFIAVDYLIYTNEVIGNIMESYPVIPLFSVMILISLIVSYLIFRRTKEELEILPNISQKLGLLISFVIICSLGLFFLPKLANFQSKNNFTYELQSNGIERFAYAFSHNELDFFKFYPTLGIQKSEKLFLEDFKPPVLRRKINASGSEQKKNVVLISVESLSAEYLKHYGNQQNITPFLDSLADKSLMFTNFYATGNRTVRGLEALTLCIPPTAGESVIKREDNRNKFTTGSVFKSKGYNVGFLYGGYSYFDNMKSFFGNNGYQIVDRDSFLPQEVSFANVWGVCDEDMAKKAIKVMNAEAKSGKPFFNHWMTVSNHRPFTYPDGKIDIPGDIKSRDGGVKYTDYALRRFFEMAKKQSWYKNTVFVIVADHCASSAGSTELPVDKYRIPAIVFSDGFVKPQKFDGLMSQIDLMPTVFGLLNFSYESKFLGQDVFSDSYVPRAYIATYENLGYIRDQQLTIISAGKKIEQYTLQMEKNNWPDQFNINYKEILTKNQNRKLIDKTIAAYEATSYWLKHKNLDQ